MEISTPNRVDGVSSALSGNPELPAVLHERTAGLERIDDLADAVVGWVEEQGMPLPSIFFEVAGRLRRVALRGYWQILEGFSVEQGIIAETFRTGEAQFVPDVSADARYIAAIPDVVAELSLPIRHQGQVVGIMNVESPDSLGEREISLARSAVRCFEERLAALGGPEPESPWQRLARRSGELADLDDPADIGDFAVRTACEIVGLDSAVLVIQRGGQHRVHAACGPLEGALRELDPQALAVLASWTASATSAYTLGAVTGRGFVGHEALQGIGIRSMASASLQSNGGRHGFLLTAGSDNIETDVERVQHLEVLANHTASALYTAFALQTLRDRAAQDPLTRLGHSATFHERLAERLASTTAPSSTAVLLIDLDNFKVINDTLGHLVGDRVIIETASLLREVLRHDDELFRIGGDEFAAILEVQSPDQAVDIADRITAAARERGRTQMSVGIAVVDDDTTDSDTAFGCADLALFNAKRAGGDQAALYRPELQAAAQAEARLQAELPQAIEDGQLFLEFQPVVSLRSGRLLGLESLVRWKHPERGLIPPVEFIPLAERSDHIAAIGRWVLTEACRSYARWQEQGWAPEGLLIGINVSAAELGCGFVETVTSTLERFAVPPDRFIIEVTEATFIDEQHASGMLGQLRDLGINVAVDDFGTGYSSLSYLQRLPVNLIKIDRSFVAEIVDPKTEAVTRSIIELAHTLGLSVVAEGIEEDCQADVLRRLGCRLGQGYLWSRPVPEAQLPALVEQLRQLVAP